MGLHPDEQVELSGIAGVPRVDFLVEECLVIEFDGEGKYHLDGDPARALWQEKLRQDRITEAGYEVLRITWADLWDQGILERRVRRALARARMRRQPTL
jgi:very-short-patch-repair endonuclease